MDEKSFFKEYKLPKENKRNRGENKNEFDFKKETAESDYRDYALNMSVTESLKENIFNKFLRK